MPCTVIELELPIVTKYRTKQVNLETASKRLYATKRERQRRRSVFQWYSARQYVNVFAANRDRPPTGLAPCRARVHTRGCCLINISPRSHHMPLSACAYTSRAPSPTFRVRSSPNSLYKLLPLWCQPNCLQTFKRWVDFYGAVRKTA